VPGSISAGIKGQIPRVCHPRKHEALEKSSEINGTDEYPFPKPFRRFLMAVRTPQRFPAVISAERQRRTMESTSIEDLQV
jgi:hypothetical protein